MNRRAGRSSLAAALTGAAAFGVVGLRGPAPAAAAPAYQQLAGVTTVTTSTSGAATVLLTQKVTLGFGKGGPPPSGPGGPGGPAGPAATGIYGGGRIAAMVLEHNGRPVVQSIRVSDCGAAGCTGGHGFGFTILFGQTLLPGLYHLYVASDSAPVTAVLNLPGLAGSSQVSVAPTPAIVLKDLTPLVPSTGTGMDPALYSAAGSDTIGDRGGFMISNITVATSMLVGGYVGACLNQGPAPPAYVGNCQVGIDPFSRENLENPYLVCDPTWEPLSNWPSDVAHHRIPCTDRYTQDTVMHGSPFPFFFGWIFGLPAGFGGTWSMGGYVQGAMLLKSESAAGLWLSYLPSERASSTGPTAAPPSATPAPTASATPTPAPTGGVGGVQLPNTSATAPPGGLASAAVLLGMAGLRLRRRGRLRP